MNVVAGLLLGGMGLGALLAEWLERRLGRPMVPGEKQQREEARRG